jgi:PAS domain S-box-containing protein
MRTASEPEVGDAERLRVLRASGLLDAGPLPSLDRLTGLAARLVGADAALVSLVDADHQQFASACGLSGELDEQRRTPLSHSYCRYVVEDRAPLVVPDARLDARLHDNPAIADYQAIAYAGFPLRTPDGHVIGSFCVLHNSAREWTAEQVATLEDLAAAAQSEIALRLAHGEQVLGAARLQAVLDSAHDAYVSIDPEGHVTSWNAAAERLFGYAADEALGEQITELIIPERFRAAHDAGMARVRATGQSLIAGQRLQLAAVDRSGREFPVEMILQVSIERDRRPVYHAFLHDISERMRSLAELERRRQELEDERTFLHALLDNLDTSVGASKADGNLAFFNRAMRDMHGRDARSGSTGDTWAQTYDLYGPDGRTMLQPDEIPLARANAGELVRGVHMVVRGDGGPRRFVANASPIDTADGRRLGAVVAMHDITEAHRAEEMRRARHAVAQVLSEATSAEHAAVGAVAVITETLGWLCGEYWQVTENRERINRVSSHTRGPDMTDFSGDEPLSFTQGEGFAGMVWQRGGEVWGGSVGGDVLGGHRAGLADQLGVRTVIGLPVRSGLRVLGVLVFFTDEDLPHDPDVAAMLDTVGAHLGRFVERRRAEDLTLALSTARRDFDRIVGQVNDYVWTIEALPGGRLRNVYGSPNGTGVFGGDPPGGDTMAAGLTALVHPDDAPALDAFQATLRTGCPAEVECRIRGFDGVIRWVWTRAVPRFEDGRVLIDGISTNVTERRELDEQREDLLRQQQQQVERLSELDRMKDELSAVVIHELRNPLGVIRGYTEMLLDSPTLAEPDRRRAVVVDRSTTHLLRLVDDLLDLARLDAGHISIDPRPMAVSRLLRDVVENHRPSASAKGLTVIEKMDPHLGVHGDAQRLRQAMDNLVSNAIKYTPDGGTVTVTAEDHDDQVVIRVADTGIGIPLEQYQHLFSRFFRASNATLKGIKGTGLGLAITRGIIDAHLGTVSAGPEPAGGTVFTVTLPAAED